MLTNWFFHCLDGVIFSTVSQDYMKAFPPWKHFHSQRWRAVMLQVLLVHLNGWLMHDAWWCIEGFLVSYFLVWSWAPFTKKHHSTAVRPFFPHASHFLLLFMIFRCSSIFTLHLFLFPTTHKTVIVILVASTTRISFYQCKYSFSENGIGF